MQINCYRPKTAEAENQVLGMIIVDPVFAQFANRFFLGPASFRVEKNILIMAAIITIIKRHNFANLDMVRSELSGIGMLDKVGIEHLIAIAENAPEKIRLLSVCDRCLEKENCK